MPEPKQDFDTAAAELILHVLRLALARGERDDHDNFDAMIRRQEANTQ